MMSMVYVSRGIASQVERVYSRMVPEHPQEHLVFTTTLSPTLLPSEANAMGSRLESQGALECSITRCLAKMNSDGIYRPRAAACIAPTKTWDRQT